MQPLPHEYVVTAATREEGSVRISAENLPDIESAPPAEFDGPGDQWSPESLFVASVADCFILTFRAIARASKFPWISLRCETEGVLDRVDGKLRFTDLAIDAHLDIPPGGNIDRGFRLLEKAERGCLVTNSLTSSISIECNVAEVGGE